MVLGYRALLLAIVFASSLAAAPALSEQRQPAGVRLSWVRTAEATGCISPLALERQVAERLGWDPFRGDTRQWIEGFVALVDGEYRVELFERDEAGETVGSRVLRAPPGDCRSLDEAASLAIALIIDPSATLQPRESEIPPGSRRSATEGARETLHASQRNQSAEESGERPRRHSSEAESRVQRGREPRIRCPTTPVLRRPREAPRAPVSGFISATPVAVAGVMPGTAFGVESAGEVSWAATGLAFRLGMTYLPEVWERYEDGELAYGLTMAHLGPCFATPGRRISGFGCGTLDLGALHTTVRQPDPLEPGDRLWVAGRLHAGLRLEIVGPLWLESRVFIGVPFLRRTYRVRVDGEPQVVYRQSWLVRGLAIGMGFHFE